MPYSPGASGSEYCPVASAVAGAAAKIGSPLDRSNASTLTPASPACVLAAVIVPDTVPLAAAAGPAPASATTVAMQIAFSARASTVLVRADGAGRELCGTGDGADHALLRADHARGGGRVLPSRGGRRVRRAQLGVGTEHVLEPGHAIGRGQPLQRRDHPLCGRRGDVDVGAQRRPRGTLRDRGRAAGGQRAADVVDERDGLVTAEPGARLLVLPPTARQQPGGQCGQRSHACSPSVGGPHHRAPAIRFDPIPRSPWPRGGAVSQGPASSVKCNPRPPTSVAFTSGPRARLPAL